MEFIKCSDCGAILGRKDYDKVEACYNCNSTNLQTVEKILATVYPYPWGFIIPCESGVVWEQQTCGVCCNHEYVEGIFIPLRRPMKLVGRWPALKEVDLLQELVDANYHGKPTEEIWEDIKKEMHFDFEVLTGRYPPNQEGLMWIRLTKFESGWGHGKEIEELVGKELVLIYPNSD